MDWLTYMSFISPYNLYACTLTLCYKQLHLYSIANIDSPITLVSHNIIFANCNPLFDQVMKSTFT